MRKKFAIKLLISVPFIIFGAGANAGDFCDGYEAGYETGYQQSSASSMTPLSPLCPLQPLKGFGDPESDYEHGYTVGYRQGQTRGQ